MALPGLAAGRTHNLILKYGSAGTSELGLMIAGGLTNYSRQAYPPFAPATRQGEATQRDFNITATWELNNSFHMGTGHLIEQQVESQSYSFAQGLDLTGTTTIGPCLFTGQVGRLLPPPADAAAVSTANFKQMIEFLGKTYWLTSDAAGKIYENDGTTTFTLRETLTAAGTQLFTDGATLYACQGASNAVRKTTDGSTWSNHTFNAHFIAKRDENNTAYITTATLTPGSDGTGQTYLSPVIGLSGYTATNMVWYDEALIIGKPDGLYLWEQGWVRLLIDLRNNPSSSNFQLMQAHRGLLYFNVRNRLYFISGRDGRPSEVVPDDLNGFSNLDSLFACQFGPLLIGARMQSRAYLFYFDGADNPGLNPLWSDADASRPVVAIGATDLFGSSNRVYFCQTTTGTRYLDFKSNWIPNTYHTKGTTQSYVELTEFTAGFRSVPKWWYEVVLNVADPTSNTKCQVWYSIDDGTFTQTLDDAGSAVTLDLDAYNKAAYFPLNATGVKIKLRIYVWTTNASTVAAITAVTLRGATMVKPRSQISFPVLADNVVRGLTGDINDSGRNILATLRTAATQGYPVKLFDWEGNARLCLFRTPYPLEAISGWKNPHGEMGVETNTVVQVLLVEVDQLDADGSYPAWTAG